MWHCGKKKGHRKVSKFFTSAIKHLCLTFKQALQDGELNAWEKVVTLCLQMYGKNLSASPCIWTHISPQCLCYPSLCNLLFSFSSSLFDFSELVIPSPGLSKRLRAIKYSSALINCSPSPFGRGGEGGKKWHWIIQGPIRAISGNCLDLDEVAQQAQCLCILMCWLR